jgi:hypothetical protein
VYPKIHIGDEVAVTAERPVDIGKSAHGRPAERQHIGIPEKLPESPLVMPPITAEGNPFGHFAKRDTTDRDFLSGKALNELAWFCSAIRLRRAVRGCSA